jgi:hypothetical protein
MVAVQMCARIRRTTLLILVVATSAIFVRGENTNEDRPAMNSDAPIAANGQPNYGVRLRKLHLVRPDLIPYPLSLEVYC